MKQWRSLRANFRFCNPIKFNGTCQNDLCKCILRGKYKIIGFERPGSKVEVPVCMRCYYRFLQLPKEQKVIDVCASSQQRHIPSTPMVQPGLVPDVPRRGEAHDQAVVTPFPRELRHEGKEVALRGGVQGDTHKQDGVDGILPG